MKKAVLKLRQCFGEYIKHNDKILLIFVFFLVALALLAGFVIFRDGTASSLQQLLGLRSEKYDVLKFIGYCVAGVVSIWLAWAANKRANAMDATAKNTEEGLRQERLKNAIEHLGHKRDSVRMGGAHELFHLAKDTGDLRRTVFDILCAHIRQTTGENKYKEKYETKPSEEMQGLLTLLFVQEPEVFEGCFINLQGSYLNGANLRQARLKKANLIEAQLQDANLSRAQLQNADLREAQLQKTFLWDTQLQWADLSNAQLRKAILWDTQLQWANLSNAQLQKAILWDAQLQRVELPGAELQGANLSRAGLQGADLSEAELQGADLSRAQLQRAHLSNAQLQGANLYKAQLQGADLEYVQLQGVSSQEYPHPSAEFEKEIEKRIGKDSELTGIIFSGGLQEEDLDTLCEGLSADQAQALREKLSPHVGLEASNELPENSGAITGAYTQEEAKQWIAEYNKAMQKVPRADDTADADSAPDSDKAKGD